MIILCAPDSFKESMSAAQACFAMERGIRSVWPDAEIILLPMADGGEGSAQTLVDALDGTIVPVKTRDANGNPIAGHIGYLPSSETAVIEVATACGLEAIPKEERSAAYASSRGVADLVLAALDKGAKRLVFSLGGSAVTDAGAGLFSGLGVRFLDDQGKELPDGGLPLQNLDSIDASKLDSRLLQTEIVVASDVRNPLLGIEGASHVFAPQKGADPQTVRQLDEALTRWANVVEETLNKSVRNQPGAGAAGGIGAALMSFADASVRPGAEFVLETIGLDKAIPRADLVLTGEGSLDSQSLSGKVPYTVAKLAHKHDKPAITFVGSVSNDLDSEPPEYFSAIVPLGRSVTDLETALASAVQNLERAVSMTCRTLQVGRKCLA